MVSMDIPLEEDLWDFLHSSRIPSRLNNYQGKNIGRWFSPKVDRILEKIVVEPSRVRRKDQWSKVQDIFSQDLPFLPLFYYIEDSNSENKWQPILGDRFHV